MISPTTSDQQVSLAATAGLSSSPIANKESRDSQPAEADEKAAPNPFLLILQLLRGRLLLTVALSLSLGCLFAATGYFAKGVTFISAGIVRVSANRPGILYDSQDDSRLRLFDAFVSSETSYIASRPVLERALIQPELERLGWAPTSDKFHRLRNSLSVESKGGLIHVSCEDSDPETSAALTNSLLDAYSELHIELSRREDTVRERQLAQRERELLQKLQQIETRIKETGKEYSLQSIASAHVRKISQIQEVDQRVNELATTVASREAADYLGEVDTGDVEIKRLVVLDHALADMLFERTKRAADLSSRPVGFGESHPWIRTKRLALDSIDNAIEDRRAQLATLGSTGALTKSGKNAAEESLQGLKVLLSRLKDRVKELREEAEELNERLINLEFLDQERKQNRMLVDETRQALEQVRVESQNTLPGTIEVRARGNIPTQPASDKRLILAGAGGIGGMGVGVVSVLVAGLLLRSLRYSDELEYSVQNAELIGVIPEKEHADGPQGHRQFKRTVHSIRNQLHVADRSRHDRRTISVTGTSDGSGTSTIALELAESFASAHHQTVLVDADMLRDTLTSQLGLSGKRGLREALLANQLNGQVTQTDTPRLHVLGSGSECNFGDEQVSLTALSKIVASLSERYEVVILDLGALSNRLTARVATAISDSVLVVVPVGEKPSVAVRVTNTVARPGTSPLMVFNRAPANDPAFLLPGGI